MKRKISWDNYFNYSFEDLEKIKEIMGIDKVFAMALMPVRGKEGFRKLDYEFAANELDVNEIMDKIQECHFNTFGLVIKDTDGACVWDTDIGWNPTKRDILGEFCDAAKERDIRLIVSFTSMNDAYQGSIHPERVSVHGKSGKKFGQKFKAGEISTHFEGEMRVDLPENISIEDYKKKIPFLTHHKDEKKGKARSTRGKGYKPLTSFMCPNSEHVDYLIELAKEVVNNYPIKTFIADYIRYDGAFTDLCACESCRNLFRTKYGTAPKILTSSEWYDFKEDTIVNYAKKLHYAIKEKNKNCITGWFCLPGPKKRFTRRKIAQNWSKLSNILDIVSPMEYPYLMGTRDDGWFWGKVGDFFHWYFIRNMKKRAHEFNSPVLTITNSVECNRLEMLKQINSFDFGFGIGIFKYFGTSESQWKALKTYGKKEFGL
ncbi:MAG: hypothetical protein GF317_00385 [Candidatus Lokiarchaeota archaeon]|nr:hypothetical protein [Candidatus Lokiarchaeota archaeon]MBD3198433.1 hypothetical protein [Candidatus Lokiarchaeota archaeon]